MVHTYTFAYFITFTETDHSITRDGLTHPILCVDFFIGYISIAMTKKLTKYKITDTKNSCI